MSFHKANNERWLAFRDERITEGRRATEGEAYAETMALLYLGRLEPFGFATYARSLGWDRGRLKRRVAEWCREPDAQLVNTTPTWWGTASGQVRTASSEDDAQQTHSKRTGDAPRARSSCKKEKETKSQPDIWGRFTASYKEHGSRTLKDSLYLPNLKKHCKKHGADFVLDAWHWACTSTSQHNWHRKLSGAKLPQAFCRADGKTLAAIVANRDADQSGGVQEPAQADPGLIFDRLVQHAAQHGTAPQPDDVHPDRPTAIRAWDTLATLGGWGGLCRANNYEVSQMRRSFVTSWGVAA